MMMVVMVTVPVGSVFMDHNGTMYISIGIKTGLIDECATGIIDTYLEDVPLVSTLYLPDINPDNVSIFDTDCPATVVFELHKSGVEFEVSMVSINDYL